MGGRVRGRAVRTLVEVDALLDDNPPAARAALGLGSAATQPSSAFQPAGSYLTANQTITLSGDATGSGATAITVTIGANRVTRGMLAQAAGATLLGATAAGNVSDLTAAQAKTFLAIAAADVSGLGPFATSASAANLTGTIAAARMPALTGDVTTSAGAVATTIAIGAVTLAKMADMATASLIYRKTAGTGVPEVNTLATLKTDLGLTGTNSGDQTITLTGDVTGSGVGSFAASIGANRVTRGMLAQAAGATLLGATAAGNVADLTAAQAKTFLAITEADVSSLTTDLTAKAALSSPQFTGVTYYQQPAPTAKTATATLTIAELLTLIITVTSTTAVTLTLPTGTLTDAGILSGALAVNEAFEWYLINLGSSSGATTIAAGTGHTLVGSATVAISTSARFLTRKTAANTFITYRIA